MSAISKEFKITFVRHGQGFHNLGVYAREDLEFTEDETLKTMNSSLTEKGLNQARLVGEKLKNTKFDVAISSDLKRAKQTAKAIVDANNFIDTFEEWRVVRERCVGEFEGREDVDASLITVEKAVADRNTLTWRPPNGESVVDVRNRIKKFLNQIQAIAMSSSSDVPMILVVSHGAFMTELYYLLSESNVAKGIEKMTPKYQNTGIAQYHFRMKSLEVDQDQTRARSQQHESHNYSLEEVRCDILSCADHLTDDKDI